MLPADAPPCSFPTRLFERPPGIRDRDNRRRHRDLWDLSGLVRHGGLMDFISILSIFILACFVGYFVVWSVTPALHTPLMSVTNAISSVIIVGALIAAAAGGSTSSKWLGLVAVALASVNIFGGFAVTARMLAMYKKKER
jgi:NAD(P) transhydrogenase subunit alpha